MWFSQCDLFQSIVKFSAFVLFAFTVLVTEGERCEVIGFIKKGECLLRRHINVAHTFPNGKKVISVQLFLLRTMSYLKEYVTRILLF